VNFQVDLRGRRRVLTLAAIVLTVIPSLFVVLHESSASAAATFLTGGGRLNSCQSLSSPNGQFVLSMQCDGNLVLIAPGNRPIWPSNTNRWPGSDLEMQGDGNAVVYSTGHIARWASGTSGHPGSVLAVQDDGNLVVVGPGNQPLWATNTAGATSVSGCASSNSCSPQTFAQSILSYPGVGAPATPANLFAIETWERAEGGGAGCPGQLPRNQPWPYSSGPAGNPLNTTQHNAGSQAKAWNSIGVQAFQNASGNTCWSWGIKATGDTLTNGDYTTILAALRAPAATDKGQCDRLASAVYYSPWGTKNMLAVCPK
jgi:hypothetical protein